MRSLYLFVCFDTDSHPYDKVECALFRKEVKAIRFKLITSCLDVSSKVYWNTRCKTYHRKVYKYLRSKEAPVGQRKRMRTPRPDFVAPPLPKDAQKEVKLPTSSISVSVFPLDFPFVQITAELRVGKKKGVALILGAGKIEDNQQNSYQAYTFGAQWKNYLVGNFANGFYLGLQADYFQVGSEDDCISSYTDKPEGDYMLNVNANFNF